jgi:hypothetical protein
MPLDRAIVYAFIGAWFNCYLDAKKSTRAITLRALVYRQPHQLSGKLIFVRRLAYSVYSYGGNLIVPPGKESIEQSLLFIKQHRGHIVIILTLKHYRKYRIKHAILPPPTQLKLNRAFAILKY